MTLSAFTFLTNSESATSTFLLPLTTTAFTFLEPITAPTPPLPAALSTSFIIAAIGDNFSPAGPIHITFVPGCASVNASVTSGDTIPQYFSASLISTVSSSIYK